MPQTCRVKRAVVTGSVAGLTERFGHTLPFELTVVEGLQVSLGEA